MARVFTIDYTIESKETSFKVSILSNTREKAIDYIYTKVGAIRINSVTQHDSVDAIDDEVLDQIVKNNPTYKTNANKLNKKNKIIKGMQDDIDYLREQLDKKEQGSQQPQTSSKEIAKAMKQSGNKIYVCPFCNFESEKRAGVKTHMAKMHKDK